MSKTIAYETANGPQQVDAAHPLPVSASVVATANTVATPTALAPSYSEGVVSPLSMDLSGGLRITGTINATSAAQATTAAPSYTNNTSNAFSQNLTGDLRVIAKQSGTWTVGLSAGANLIGSVGIDQTTPGTTNLVAASNFPATLDVNSGNKSNSTVRVVEATDAPAQAARGTAATGAAVPSGALYLGASVAGTLTGLIATANGLKVDGSAATQPVSGTVTANAGTNLNTSLLALEAGGNLATVAGFISASVGQVNVKQINGVTTLMGNGVTGTGSQRITLASDNTAVALWGHGATAAAVPANSVLGGARAATANPTAVTNGQMVGLMADKLGKLVAVGAVRDLKGSQKATLSNTTAETTIITAVASTFLDLYGLILANSGSTTTKVDIRDDTAGTIIATIEVPTLETRGFMLPVDSAIPQTTVNKNWTAQCTSATTALEVTALYVKNI